MLFLSTYRNRIDKKGRISVPSPFRAHLAKEEFQGIVAYVSMRHGCIEACGTGRFQKLQAHIESMDPFSEERDALSTTVFSESVLLSFDTEGRVMLPAHLLQAAGISEEAVFAGKGETFEIWEPSAYEAYAANARQLVKKTFYGKGGKA